MFDPARLVFIDETSTNTVTGVCVLWVFRLDFRLAGSCSLSLAGGAERRGASWSPVLADGWAAADFYFGNLVGGGGGRWPPS